MNYSEVKELLAAGFTHDEIMSFAQNPQDFPQDEKQTSVQTEEQPEEKKQNPVQPEKIPEETKPDSMKDNIDKLSTTIEQFIKTVQQNNLLNNTIRSLPVNDIQTQVDDIMKSIIRPEKKE